jgi:hypothetical protein
MGIGKAYLPGIRQRFLELRIGFSGKPDDEIGPETGSGIPLPE